MKCTISVMEWKHSCLQLWVYVQQKHGRNSSGSIQKVLGWDVIGGVYSGQVKYRWYIKHKRVFSDGVRQRAELYWLCHSKTIHTVHVRQQQSTCPFNKPSTTPLLERELQGSFHYFLAKDLGTDNKRGEERGEETVKSDWLNSKSPILLFIWTLPSHSVWLPARETVLLFLHFFPLLCILSSSCILFDSCLTLFATVFAAEIFYSL